MAKDNRKALEYFEQAGAQKHAAAQFRLGIIYEQGRLVPQNISAAKEWYGKSCDNGNQEACEAYRRLSEEGY